jgi:hypothetical protein
MRDPGKRDRDLPDREKLHAALSEWVAAHNVLGEVRTFTVGFEAEHGTDRPLDPVQMYEVPAGELWRLLDADVAGRAGQPPEAGDPARGIRYAGARLGYLLDGPVRTSGWPQPADAAEALGELARLAEMASALVAQADTMLGRELRGGRVTPVPAAGSGRAAAPTDVAARFHDSAAGVMSGLGEAAAQLRRMQMRAGNLQRTMRAAVAGTSDGPTLRAQYLARCSPIGWTSAYHVRVFEPAGQRPLVIIGELGDSHSTHLNNAIEAVAAAVSEHLLDGRGPDAVTWAQYEPAEEFYSRYEEDEDADAASDDREDLAYVIGFAAGFTTTNSKKKASPDELERLAGGPVRRWHVYDYTMAAVTADGAQPVTLPASRRRRRA